MKIVAGNALNHRKPTQAPTRQADEQREVVLAGRDERDPDVGEQHDRRAAGGEAVEAVGEVDRARRARDDEVDEHRVEEAEVDRGVDERRRSVSARPAFSVAIHHSPTEIAIVTPSFVRARRPSERRLTIFV